MPKLLQQASARLQDNTTVYPLATGDEDAFLSLSGILFVGRTADQRYVLHEHLVDLGLAGPPAPILNWAGHLQDGPRNTHILPFRSLTVLPDELLAIPVPSTSWAFVVAPVMSLGEWESYRQRCTSTVFIMPTESKLDCFCLVLKVRVRKFLAIIGACWPLESFLASYLCRLQSGLSRPPHPQLMQPAMQQVGCHRCDHGLAKSHRFLLQREIPSNVAPCVREHLEWQHEDGHSIQIFNFHSLEHLALQAAPPAKRRAANHISPQPACSQALPQPPVFGIFQEEPTRQCGVYASQAARQGRDVRPLPYAGAGGVVPPAPLSKPSSRGNS